MCNSLRTRQLGLQQLSQHPAQSKQSQGLCQPVMVEKLEMGKADTRAPWWLDPWAYLVCPRREICPHLSPEELGEAQG